ncbi:autotransporter domain-containing protein [Pseudomonas sp. hsmgli-8]|uniref:Autotransporter domain-containing protein n=1 Tax=Pseudomonas quercus TaxID=2722792 RepID=A0ABX0YIR0_9PSED|nr:autotransporter outer membrane beta-barrel domain-containing protein [Pseudomonas quercus]MBF7143079.1 autotransporter domain-containing protein [Pseudomonas sp. LY10J]NJP01893.1 autotransporter domain-containing protein [Pseudomonas quercus]
MDISFLKTFSKTVLALAIGACTTPSYAVDFDISQGSVMLSHQQINDSITISGVASRKYSARKTEIELNAVSATGSVVNSAGISIDGAGFQTKGFVISGGYPYSNAAGYAGTIGGDIRNNGTLSINNAYGVEGIEVGPVVVKGSFVNAGSISIGTASSQPTYGTAEGVYFHGTKIEGDLINSGLIEVAADEGTGLTIDRDGYLSFEVGGRFINSGTILVTGTEVDGIDIEAPTSPLDILNSGSVKVIGDDSNAIHLWEGTINALSNSGEIIAEGANTHAIVFEGATLSDNLPSGERGVINTGTIRADDDAIVVTEDAPREGFEINQRAGQIVSTNGAAIQGGGLATLNWSGGDIQGDLMDMAGVNVTGPAGFRGSRIDSNVSVSKGGSLNLASAGTAITGDLDVARLSAIDMRLSNATVNTTPYLTVGGVARFADGARITLSANPGDFTPTAEGKTYSLLSASAVQDGGLRVASSSALLNVASYSVDPTSVAAVVTLKSDQQVNEDLGSVGVEAPATGIVNRFKNTVLGGLKADDRVYQAFANANTETLARLSKQLAPEVSRGGVDAAMAGQSATSRAIGTRINSLRGMSSGDVLTNTGVWAQALNSTMDQNARDGVAGYSANAGGIAVGADGMLNPDTTVGLAYSYVNANVTSDTGNKTDVQGGALALYGNWQLGNWFTQGSLSYGHNDNDSKRYVAGTLAKGSYDSDVLSVNTLAGYTFKMSEQLVLEPRVAARYANVQVDGYTEHGSSAALRNGDQRFETGEVGAGLRVAGNSPLFGGSLQPEATLMAYHDLIGDRINQTSAFSQGGATFAVTGAKPVRDTYEGTVGLNYAINALTLGVSYTYEGRSGYNADTTMLKARYAF